MTSLFASTNTNNLPSPIVTTIVSPSPVNNNGTMTMTTTTPPNTITTNQHRNLSLASSRNEAIFISSGGDVIVCRCRDSSYPFGNNSSSSATSTSKTSKTKSSRNSPRTASSTKTSSNNNNATSKISSTTTATTGWNSYMWRSPTLTNPTLNGGGVRPSMNDLTNCCHPHTSNAAASATATTHISSNDTVATTSLEIDDLSCHVQTHAAGAAFCNPWVSSAKAKTKTTSHSRTYSSGASISSQVLDSKRSSGGGGLLGGAPAYTSSPVIVASNGGGVTIGPSMDPNDYPIQQQQQQPARRQVHYDEHNNTNDNDLHGRFNHFNQYIDVEEDIGSDDDNDNDGDNGSCILPIQSFDHTHFYEDDVSTTTYNPPPSTRSLTNRSKNILSSKTPKSQKSSSNTLDKYNNNKMDTTARITNTSGKNHAHSRAPREVTNQTKLNNNNNKQPSPSSLLRFVVEDVKMVPSPEMVHGVPTFLNSFQTVKILKVSAHPLGSHVLLISNAGLLFSYGLNDYGQLGVGFQSNVKDRHRGYVMTPTIVVPLVENGGKAIACAAGVSHSLVVVETEEQRLIKHHSSSHHHPTSTTSNNNNGGGGGVMDTSATSSTDKYYHRSGTTGTTTTTTSGDNNNNENNETSPSASQQSSSSTTEYHHQLYGFGRNDYMKIGLINPRPSKQQQQQKLQQLKVTTVSSTTNGNGNSDTVDEMEVTVLPRRVALRCRVHPEHHHSPGSNCGYGGGGIFAIEASVTHSAALVRRSSGAVDLYTWGNASQYALGLPAPTTVSPGTTPTATNTSSTTTISSKNNNKSTVRIAPVPTIVPQLSTSGQSTKTTSSPTEVPSAPSSLLLQENGEYPCQISLGPASTYVVTSLGRCFAFGASDGGMLGHGPSIKEQRIPKIVQFPPPTIGGDGDIIKSVHAGASHVVATTTSGIVYGWGTKAYCGLLQDTQEAVESSDSLVTKTSNDQSQSSAIVWTPTEIDIGCSSSSCTKENTTIHGNSPATAATNVFVTNACVGYDSSYFVADTGKVFSCGKPSGRLGQGECTGTDHSGTSDNNKNNKTSPTTTQYLPPQPLFGGMHLFWNPKGRYVTKPLQPQQQQGNKQQYVENGSLSQYPTKSGRAAGNISPLPPPPSAITTLNQKSQLRHSSATSTESLLHQRSQYHMKKHTSE